MPHFFLLFCCFFRNAPSGFQTFRNGCLLFLRDLFLHMLSALCLLRWCFSHLHLSLPELSLLLLSRPPGFSSLASSGIFHLPALAGPAKLSSGFPSDWPFQWFGSGVFCSPLLSEIYKFYIYKSFTCSYCRSIDTAIFLYLPRSSGNQKPFRFLHDSSLVVPNCSFSFRTGYFQRFTAAVSRNEISYF